MKILRNNKEIELTEDEMITAYYIMRRKWDEEDMVAILWDDNYENAIKEMGSELAISAAAEKYRKYLMDDYCDNGDLRYECMRDARDYVKRAVENGEFNIRLAREQIKN